MKKKIFILLIILLTFSGCQNEFYLEFNQDNIVSTITSTTTLDEYSNYVKNNYGNGYNNMTEEEMIAELTKDKTGIYPALINNDNEHYIQVSKDNKDGVYINKISYTYTYNNFNDNYFLNNCFEVFSYKEDENMFYYTVGGKYTCGGDISTLSIKADNLMIENNAETEDNGYYTWLLKESEDNEISFVIAKKEIVEKNIYNTILLIGGIVFGIILLIAIIMFYKKILSKK